MSQIQQAVQQFTTFAKIILKWVGKPHLPLSAGVPILLKPSSAVCSMGSSFPSGKAVLNFNSIIQHLNHFSYDNQNINIKIFCLSWIWVPSLNQMHS